MNQLVCQHSVIRRVTGGEIFKAGKGSPGQGEVVVHLSKRKLSTVMGLSKGRGVFTDQKECCRQRPRVMLRTTVLILIATRSQTRV